MTAVGHPGKRERPMWSRTLIFLPCLMSLSCGNPSPPPAPAKQETKDEAKADAVAARKAEREAKAAAAEAEKKAMDVHIDALAVVPEGTKLPKKPDQACKQMLDAYDAYMRKVLTGDMLTKWETGGNEMQLKVFGDACKKSTIEVAVCQANALTKMKPELEKELATVMTRCKEKYGGA